MGADVMQVECSHHIDASEADAEGFYEYYYEYDIYRFTLGSLSLVVRSYSDTCEHASVLRLEEAGKSRPLQPKDLKRPLVQQAREHLQSLGKQELRWFNPRHARYDPL
ncbi:hypothetical protein [Comamonas resistens]|uniref:Uncharacterized protein n=1 Tax=Comamonas resistens TaxID=3046670 RepID=A0ABY8SN53_9BURK|nr:hypothetical protein [Comamonas resistens]MDL5038340.1 hypothetical protein [Comamonas resistens]WHS64495.1 hypothetical protein QMY55_18665 [Comamonas resistens]